MSAPVTLLLVVGLSGGEVRSGQLRATLDAQLDSSRVQVRLRRADGVPRLEQVLEAASQQGPVAVVTNPRRGQLQIRVALEPGKWVSRTFNFSKRDPLRERNRTVALAIAAMVPEWRLPTPLPEPEHPLESAAPLPPLSEAESFAAPAPPDAGPELPAGAPDAGAPDTGTPDAGAPDAAAPPEVPGPEELLAEPDAGVPFQVEAPAPPEAGPQVGGFELELGALAGSSPLAPGIGLGAGYCAEHWCVGLLARGHRGEIREAAASLWRAGAMVTGRARLPLGVDRVRGALQVSVGPGWLMAQRAEQVQSHWQLESALEAEVSVRLAGKLWLFVRGGAGVVSGAIPVFVNDVEVARLPIVSAQGAAGLRLGQ